MTMPNMNEPSALEDSLRGILGGEHQRLGKLFDSIIKEAGRMEPTDLRDAWQNFEGQLLAQFDAEEAHVLPVFGRSQPKEAREIVDDHARIRGRLVELAIDLDLHCLSPDRVKIFVDELRAHAAREELALHPWAARQLEKVAGAHLRRTPAMNQPGGGTAPNRREEWRIDPARSTLRFSLRHIIVQEIRGEFKRWGGTLSVDEVNPTNSGVRIWVDLDSVDTGEPERDAQVCSPEFFDVGRFPRATFTSTDIRLPDQNNPVVRGRLDLHGANGAVDLEIVRREERTDADGTVRAVYSIKGHIDRRNFRLRWNQDLDVGGVVVGDQVQIDAQVEATRNRS